MWSRVIKYYASRVTGIRSTVITSNWIYFLRLVLPLGITIKEEGNLYKVYNPILKHTAMMRPNSSDVLVYLQIFFKQEYNVLNSLQLPINPVVIDLGANAGFFMLLAKSRWPDANIVCVEPDTKNYRQLELQVKENHLSNVQTLQAGVWITNESLKMNPHPDGLEWAHGVNSDPKGDVPGFTIERLLTDHTINHVDLLKIDIEGTEEILFENASFLETLSRTVANLIMETHNVEKQQMIASRLRDLGFNVTLDRELIFANQKRA